MAQDLWLRMSTLLAPVHTCDRRVGIRPHGRTLSATKFLSATCRCFFCTWRQHLMSATFSIRFCRPTQSASVNSVLDVLLHTGLLCGPLCMQSYFGMAPLAVCLRSLQAHKSRTECYRNFKFDLNILPRAYNWYSNFRTETSTKSGWNFQIDADLAANFASDMMTFNSVRVTTGLSRRSSGTKLLVEFFFTVSVCN